MKIGETTSLRERHALSRKVKQRDQAGGVLIEFGEERLTMKPHKLRT